MFPKFRPENERKLSGWPEIDDNCCIEIHRHPCSWNLTMPIVSMFQKFWSSSWHLIFLQLQTGPVEICADPLSPGLKPSHTSSSYGKNRQRFPLSQFLSFFRQMFTVPEAFHDPQDVTIALQLHLEATQSFRSGAVLQRRCIGQGYPGGQWTPK